MFRIALVLLAVWLAGSAFGQGLMQRKRPEIIPTDGKMRRGGFYFAPGVTHALAPFKDREKELLRVADTSYLVTFQARGGFAPYLEVGWFHATRDPVILDYWDVGLAYKGLAGRQRHDGIFQRGGNEGDSILLTTGDGVFDDRYLTLHVNANKFIQTGDRQFVQLTLGANADLDIGSGRSYAGDPLVLADQELPASIWGQLHVKVGYGFKASQRLLVIPALESPIFSFSPPDRGLGQVQWFNTRYRPLLLSVRFLFLRYPKGFACPPAIKHNQLEKGRHKTYKPDTYHP